MMDKSKLAKHEAEIIEIFKTKLSIFSKFSELGFVVHYYLDGETFHYTSKYEIDALGLHDYTEILTDNCYKIDFKKCIYGPALDHFGSELIKNHFNDYSRYKKSKDIDFLSITVPNYSIEFDREVWMQVMGNVLLRDQDGYPLMTLFTLYDICDFKEYERDLIEYNERLERYLEVFNAGEAVGGIGTYHMNLEESETEFWGSDNSAKIFGTECKDDNIYTLDSWVKGAYSFSEKTGDMVLQEFNDFIEGKKEVFDILYDIMIDNEKHNVVSHAISQKRDENGKVLAFLGSVKDITEIVEKEAMLESMVYIDRLTGLYNESKFEEDYNSGNLQYASLVFIDINRFKIINDNYGHQFGDDCIRAFVERNKRILEELYGDSYVTYRIYGDEFIVNLDFDIENFNKHNDCSNFDKLFEPYNIDDTIVNIDFSMGVLTTFDITDDIKDTFRKIDVAMYLAKRNKKWYHIKDGNQSEILDEEYYLELRIKTELGEENIVPYFQPIYDISTNKIIEFEALARIDFDGVIIGPNKFIEVARRRKLLSFIDITILKKSIKSITELTTQGIIDSDVKIAVNFSMGTLKNPELFSILEKIRNEKFDLSRLIIELTEGEVTEMLRQVKIINRLKELGITIAIDDFSAGNSSINTLVFNSMQTIKLDQNFLWEAMFNDDIKSMYRYFVIMFNKKKINVVAEGVENKEQIKFLKEIGVKNLQGYALSLPIPLEEIESTVKVNCEVIDEVNIDFNKESRLLDFYKIPSYDYNMDVDLMENWKSILNHVSDCIGVQVAVILRIENDIINVFCKNNNDFSGIVEFSKMIFDDICMKDVFYVGDIRKSKWNDDVFAKFGLTSCLGVPLMWPDDSCFGTMILIDHDMILYNEENSRVIKVIKGVIEEQLKVVKIKTENTKLKEKLSNTSVLLKSMACIGKVGMYIVDLDNQDKLEYYNEELIDILGLTPEEKRSFCLGDFPYVTDDSLSNEMLRVERINIKNIMNGTISESAGVIRIYNRRLNENRLIKTSRETVEFKDDGSPKKIHCVVIDVTNCKGENY